MTQSTVVDQDNPHQGLPLQRKQALTVL